MHEISESENPMPEELGRAERSMRQAEKELQRGREFEQDPPTCFSVWRIGQM